jgi:imidazolonepropionase-like amidohydrolase
LLEREKAMKPARWFVAWSALLLLGQADPRPSSAAANEPGAVTAFTNVTVLTMRPEGVLPDHVVLVRDGLIAEVGPKASVTVPPGATVIDGQGAYLMPGLVDMHVHPVTPDELLSFLAYGVTTVANLDGSPSALRWRRILAEGKLVGPNLYTAGPITDGRPIIGMFAAARTVDQARALVADQKRAGYDWVKVYNTLKPEVYHAILDAAKAHRMAVIGHIPWYIRDPAELKRGQAMVAHAEEFVGGLFGGMNAEKIPGLTRAVKEAGTTVTPNLVAYTFMLASVRDLNRVLDDPECDYLSPAAWSLWLPSNNRYSNRDARTFGPRVEAGHAFMGRFVKAFHDAGVPLLVGTDTAVTGFPGRSAQEEIRELAGAGIAPRDALAAATRNAGEFVGKTVPGAVPFGTVAVGQRADLILLAANPLDDLGNLRKLRGVMVRGRWWPSERVAEMRRALLPRYRRVKKEVVRLTALVDAQKLREAAEVFRAARAAYPEEDFLHPHVLYTQMERALAARRFRDALELARMNAELHPDHFAVLAQLGRVYRLVGDAAKAEKCLKQSLQLCPANGVALDELEQLNSPRKTP